ncbi:anaerobic nitric oxide reductase flavorubredoxin [Citrobacter koseri]|uniref:Anaerobic nitric oxide reductase flavorubredoxin n=1 Tax=Citrobacter koseri TaxID=545 RepID=A0A2X2WP94_CITKO|nr:anaerobic nitric oxide reductase flavorubredoxin [Citrobacter koseri]
MRLCRRRCGLTSAQACSAACASGFTTLQKVKPLQDVAPGTPWSDVPDNFLCPECSLGKDVFDVLATEAK